MVSAVTNALVQRVLQTTSSEKRPRVLQIRVATLDSFGAPFFASRTLVLQLCSVSTTPDAVVVGRVRRFSCAARSPE